MPAHYSTDDVPSDYDLYLYSDVHVGAKAFHEVAFRKMVAEIKRRPKARAICLGDLVEGQTTDHRHYDHTSIEDVDDFDLHTPNGQFAKFAHLIAPIAHKHYGILKGNHDWRFDKVRPFVNELCKELGIPYLGTKVMVRLGGLNVFLSHIGRRLSNRAGSPAQLRVNQEESLRRNFTTPRDYWASANLLAHGHTHQLILARPVQPDAQLMSKGDKFRMRVIDPSVGVGKTVDGYEYVPPQARWYAVTGTFRRSGHIQDVNGVDPLDVWEDYSDRFNYPPSPIGYIKLRVKDDVIVDGEEVFC